MKIAYLLLVHRNPKLIKRMTDYLSYENCAFFLHVDKKSNIGDFLPIEGKNVIFTGERLPVYWGEYSMVEAILILIRHALNESQTHDYYFLLSGHDYPIKSKEYIHSFLDQNRGAEFISMVKMPCAEAGKPISRINTLRIPSDRKVYQIFVKILARLGLAQRDYRNYLGTLEPYAGSTWWCLTREACQYISEFAENNRPVCRYFENTFASDEMFFHTILGNSVFKNRIRRNLLYDNWSNRGPHPSWVTEKHVAFFESQAKVIFNDIYGSGEMLFARKFSDDTIGVVERIEAMIEQKKRK